MTVVERYWTDHTVRASRFPTAPASLAFLDWRFAKYPLFRELMEMWGEHDGETILDYGCGPGNDLAGFRAYTGAARIIGMDVSTTALALARVRMALHGPVDLVKVSDADPTIPLPDASVDFIQCEGVLHHATHPEALLAEFHRVLRPGGRANVMVHNRDSLWVHLYVAWQRQIVKGIDAGLSLEEAFGRSTDGSGCPISRFYVPSDFAAMCSGFDVEYVGGYFNRLELDLWAKSKAVLTDKRLGAEHCDFLAGLSGTTHNGLPAGLFGCYRLTR